MDKAFDKDSNLINATNAHKNIEGYTCPCCGELVKKAEGKVQKAHFRHARGGKKEWCDLYTQGLGGFYDPSDYATLMKIPYITFEESESGWDFHLTFPKIPSRLTRTFEDMNLYFNIACLQQQETLSSVHLRHDSIKNKMRIDPAESYQLTIDKRVNANKLELYWPEKINGFRSDFYLFAYIHGEFVKMEQKDLSLHEIFYVVSKREIMFHDRLTVRSLNFQNGWYAYKINLPDILDNHLIDWFCEKLGYRLKHPYYYLDLVAPSYYARHENAISIDKNECEISLAFSKFKHDNPTIVHIKPDLESVEIRVFSEIINRQNLQQGFHTFYLKGHEGKMLTFYLDSKKEYNLDIHYENDLMIDEKIASFFEDKEIHSNGTKLIAVNIAYEVWYKEKGEFPNLLRTDQYELTIDESIIYTPCVWSVGILSDKAQLPQIDFIYLLKAYMRLEYVENILITPKQYQSLIRYIEEISDGVEKQKLKYYIRLYRNRAPMIVKSFLRSI